MTTLSRREALKRAMALLGGTVVGGNVLLVAACSERRDSNTAKSDNPEVALLDEIAETILPETETPGAKAAAVGAFMALMVEDVYDASDQQVFRDGMAALNKQCLDETGHVFVAATADERLALLKTLDKEQYEYMQTHSDGEPVHYFRMMKELTVLGYYTSEIGQTHAMRYVETPGRYDACVSYEEGDTQWV